MITLSGVRFESGPKGWRAVLPEGTYLPEALVVEQSERGLSAHLEAPLDQSFVFPCKQQPDGSVAVQLTPDDQAEVIFDPASLQYGVRSSLHSEGYRANGNWTFDWQDRDRSFRVEQTPAGELSGTYNKGGSTVPMAVKMDDRRLSIGPDQTPLKQRIKELGLFSGLSLAVRCFMSGSLNSFYFRDTWELFPKLASRAGALRAEMEASTATVKRIARPPEAYSGVKVTDQSVAVGGVILRRATRTDPQPGS